MRGLVEAVDVVPVRGFLVEDAPAGATALLVDDGDPFAVEGAQAVLAGVAHPVVSVVAGEGEDDPATVIVETPLASLVEAGEPVGVLPVVEYTTATVVLAGDMGVVEATVDQGLQGKVALQEGPYEGLARPSVEVELIDGEHFIVGVDGRGADDASNLVGELPQAIKDQVEGGTVTPVRPDASPTPTVDGFAGVMLARWLGVINETPVTYDVHVSAVNTAAPSGATLVDSVVSTMLDLRVLADGSPLAYDTTYYVAVVARSGDLAADPSPWVPGQLDRTRSADIAADAIDGMTITGGVFRTGSAGAREEISTPNGYVSYNSAEQPQTTIKDGKFSTQDGAFSGSIIGGAISIAQGIATSLTQDFETASGTTAPTGWTRQVIASQGSRGGVSFETSGGNPGRSMRLRTGAVGAGQTRVEAAYPTGISAQDTIAEFDYRWDGADPIVALGADLSVMFRAGSSNPAATGLGVIQAQISRGYVAIRDGNESLGRLPLPRVAAGTWSRLRIAVRGATLSATLTVAGASSTANVTLRSAPVAGVVAFTSSTDGGLGAVDLDMSAYVDNVSLEVLQTGLQVAPDGGTTVERLKVNQSAEAPDPTVPLGVVNKRTLQSLAGTWVSAVQSPVSPFSASTVYFIRMGFIVYVVGGVRRADGSSNTNFLKVCDIPVGYRPESDELFSATPNWNSSGAPTGMFQYRAETSGQLTLRQNAAVGATASMAVSGYYIVSATAAKPPATDQRG